MTIASKLESCMSSRVEARHCSVWVMHFQLARMIESSLMAPISGWLRGSDMGAREQAESIQSTMNRRGDLFGRHERSQFTN
jgi:hypothetical protein